MFSRYLPEMSWTAVQDYLDRGGDLAIVSVGSTENHGPHAPLGTDSIVTEELCRRLADRLDALVAPVLPVGFAAQHLPFPGSITLRHETVAQVLMETALSLASQGFKRFIFLSGHGGNRIALELVSSNLKLDHPELQVLHANILAVQTSRAIRDKVESAYGKPLTAVWEAHAGEQEAAAVLAVRPELVNLAAAAPEPDMTEFLAKARDPEVARINHELKAFAPAGNWGDPSPATAGQGELFYEAMVEHLAVKIAQKWD